MLLVAALLAKQDSMKAIGDRENQGYDQERIICVPGLR